MAEVKWPCSKYVKFTSQYIKFITPRTALPLDGRAGVRAGRGEARCGLGLQVSACSLLLLPSRANTAINAAHVPRIPMPASQLEPEAQACTIGMLTATPSQHCLEHPMRSPPLHPR